MISLATGYERLQRRASITSSARFNASERVQARATLAIWAVAMMSTYVMMLSLASLIAPPTAQKYAVQINLLNVALSLIVLIVSIIEAMRDHGKMAHVYHEAALKVREIQHAVANAYAGGGMSAQDLEHSQTEYDKVLRETAVNHLEIDVLLVEITKGIARDSAEERRLGWFEIVLKRVKYARLWANQFLLYWACMVGAPLTVAFSLFKWGI